MPALDHHEPDVLDRLARVSTAEELQALRKEVLGKQAPIAVALKELRQLPAEERAAAGQRIHDLRTRLTAQFDLQQARLGGPPEAPRRGAAAGATQDFSLPGRRVLPGAPHPLRLIEQEVVNCLIPLGFEVAAGRLIEHEWYNFEALNMGVNHPARDMHDTFFVRPDVVLRTHTSSVQIRTMKTRPAPVRILAPGMVFRRDEVDATHMPAFAQIEGLWVDETATFADLKGVLRTLLVALFGATTAVRFRPSYFPFTEPSCEVDVGCSECAAGGASSSQHCKVCRGTGWLEVLGAGMVHPSVLLAVGYDPEKVQGFAFGLGIDRLAMLRWGIDDIRMLYDNDVRFLRRTAGLGNS
jgi:phenylalanyl-tRNA synthetase alpha chain